MIYSPNAHDGGTTLLLARLGEAIARRGGTLRVIDFPDGAVARHLRRAGVSFEHTPPDPARQTFADDECVILILLHARFLREHFRPAPTTRFLFIVTHPHDGFKLLPTFNLVLERSNLVRRNVLRTLHRGAWRSVGRFLDEAARTAGIAYMDGLTWETNRDVFRLVGAPPFLPVSMPSVEHAVEVPVTGVSRVVWIGRLAHFKTPCVENLIRALAVWSRSGHAATLTVIGDGPDREKLAAIAEQEGLVTEFLGHLPGHELERVLRSRCDLLVAHGMSVLESARLGLPSLVCEGIAIPTRFDEVRVRWLQDEKDGEVGRLVERASGRRGVPFASAFDEWAAPGGARRLGQAALAHFRAVHAADAVERKFGSILERNELTWSRIQATGFPEQGVIARGVQRAKSLYHAWKE